jgi:3-dehydrosphinganine reductase
MAKHLASCGAHIWILSRDPVKLDAARQEIAAVRQSADQQVLTLAADVTDFDQLASLVEPLIEQSGAPDMLFNSAGITYPGEFTELDLEIFHEMMDVNYFGTLHAARLVVPGMKVRGSGQIVNISSLVGIQGLYGYSAYSPSKFAVTGLSDVLRYELKPFGIQVSVAFPSDTETPQLVFENKHKPLLLKVLSESNTKVVSPEVMAGYILREVERGRYYILPGSDARFWYFVYRLFPGDSMYRVVDLLMAQARRKIAKNNGR